MRAAVFAGALLLCLLPAGAGEGDEACLKCHADRAALEKAREDPSRPVDRLLVDRDRFGRSVHASRGCAECHDGFDKFPHPKKAETVSCSDCHDDQATALAKSVHGKVAEGKRAPKCADCHGVHDVFKATDPDSRLYPLKVYLVCGSCHFGNDPTGLDKNALLKEKYLGDEHGYGLVRAGLVVAATCVSCHGGHDIAPKDAPSSRVAPQHIDQVCGKCHVGAYLDYRKSIHYAKFKEEPEGAPRSAPTCTNCHTPHHIHRADDDFRLQSVKACSNCHPQRSATYRQTYHGKVARLGAPLGYGGNRIATCEACHGNHAILPRSDPASKINPANIVSTCGQCHEGAHAEFATYLVHADPRDGEHYPKVHLVYAVMNGLLISVLILGVLHALLWLIRSLAAGEWRHPPHDPAGRTVRRWRRRYVTFHIWMMTSVLVLASTGLPLHYSDRPWSHVVMGLLGGPAVAGAIHRMAAIALTLLFVVFVGDLARRVFWQREKGLLAAENTMLPRWKDVQDVWGNIRWFLFLAPRPRYDRWTYWEKFDFWAAFWGLFVIGLSGLMLWFPVEATRFVPGWFLNAAVVVHGIEALLDIAFIFTVHVFHANLRPDKFPIDTMFLTGRMPEAEFRHDRPLEYERLRDAGQLEAIYAAAPRDRTRMAAYVIGTIALLVGFFFVTAMIVAVFAGP
jgi:cytochrome b subunit of formate dehydrogenase